MAKPGNFWSYLVDIVVLEPHGGFMSAASRGLRLVVLHERLQHPGHFTCLSFSERCRIFGGHTFDATGSSFTPTLQETTISGIFVAWSAKQKTVVGSCCLFKRDESLMVLKYYCNGASL
jgi:hypothetical protein